MFSKLYKKIDSILDNNAQMMDLMNCLRKEDENRSKKSEAYIRELRKDIKELQEKQAALQKEILNQKNINIQCQKEIEAIKEKLYRMDWEPNLNIKQRLQHLAGMQTAEFIVKNMNQVQALNVELDILDLAFSKCMVEGLILEFGVFSGKTINRIAGLTDKKVYGFDSFEGLPENWRSGFEKGTFKTDGLPQVKDNVELINGWFNETLPNFLNSHKGTSINSST